MAVFTSAGVAGFLGVQVSLFTSVSALALNAAVGIGLSLAARALSGEKASEKGGINGSLQAGGDVARSIVLGRTCTAGSLVYANTWGKNGKTPNGYFTQVIALADHPIRELTGMWVNGDPATIGAVADPDYGYPIMEYRDSDGDDHMWVKWYDGTQTTADSFLVNTVSSSQRPYASNRVGKGVAYAIVTSKYYDELFTGFPSFKFEIQGRKLYDISKDSTAGGSGTHRLADPSTWGGDGDDLLAVQVYNLLLGIHEQSTWLYGIQSITSPRLPAADWIAQINKCRQSVQGPDGPEPQFVTGGEITVDTTIGDAIDKLLTGGNARLVESAGVYKIRVGEPDAPVASFTDDEILSTEEQSFTPFFGLSETVNGITATYPEPNEGWNTKAAPPLYNNAYEIEDGNRRLLTAVPMDYVYRPGQVQRLMKAALNEARRARRHTIVLPPAYWTLEPGDIISWTSERNGYVNKLMRVDGVGDRANLDVLLDLTEVDPSDYDWNQSTDYTPPVFAPIGTIYPTPQPIVDFFASASVAQDSNGNNRRCAILLGWDGDQEDVDFVMFEIRAAWDLGVIYTGRTERVSVGSILIAPGTLLPNQSYQVRARYATYAGNRPFEWSAWIPVTMLDIRFGPLDIYPFDVESFNRDVTDMWKWQNDALRYVQEELDRQGKIIADGQSGTFTDRQQLRRELTSVSGEITAAYTEAITVATGPGSAIVTRIEDLSAKVDNDIASAISSLSTDISNLDGRVSINTSSITSLNSQLSDKADVTAVNALTTTVTNQGNTITAQGNAITGLSSTVGRFSADGLFRVTTEATPSGALSRIGLSASATEAGATTQAAMFIEAIAGGKSRIIMNSDEFYLTNGTNSTAPFSFIGGQATMMLARINEITAGTLRSPDNRVVFNLTAGTLIFRD